MEYKERRRQQGRQTEQAILSSALSLMREKGFDQISVRDICAHAGITTGAFYHHFRSKDELLDRGFAPLDRYMEEVLAGCEHEPPLQRLDRMMEAYAAFMEQNGGELVRRYYQQRLAKPSMRGMDSTRFTLRALLDCFREIRDQGILRSSLTPEEAARFSFSHFRGIVIDWVLSGGQESLIGRMRRERQAFNRLFL